MPRRESEEDDLLTEANRINYRLRSTFFYRKLKEYNTLELPSIVTSLMTAEPLYNSSTVPSRVCRAMSCTACC
jgi:hypothetical protein